MVESVEQEQRSDDRSDDTTPTYSVLDAVSRALHVPSGDLDATLHAIVGTAVRTIAPADAAGVIVVRRGRLEPVATTGEGPARLDHLQQRLGHGPCFEAATTQQTVVVTDLRKDQRWPDLHTAAIEEDIAGMLCVPLTVEDVTTGAISLYSPLAGALDGLDLALVELFATFAALALSDAQRVSQLRAALESRDVLGQAKGILIERHRISGDEAFRRLSRVSQESNQKVVRVAEHLVHTGELAAG